MCNIRAVVLCGESDEIWPITSPCKALLPVANQPLIEDVLQWIGDAGLTDALLLAPSSQQAALGHFVRSRRHSDNKSPLKVSLETFAVEEVQGTARVLAWAASRGHLKGDFVVVPCDLAIRATPGSSSNVLASLINNHRVSDDLVTSLFFERLATEKGKDPQSRLMTVYEPKAGLLLDIKDFNDFDEEVPLRTSLLKAYPSAQLATNLLPAHVYVCSSRILDYLAQIPKFESFKSDFIPFLAKAQWQSGLVAAYNEGPALQELKHPQALAISHSTTAPVPKRADQRTQSRPTEPSRPALKSLQSSMYGTLLTSAYSSNDVRPSDASPRPPVDAAHWPRSSAVTIQIWNPSDGLCMRVASVTSYAELNRLALRAIPEPEGISGQHLSLGEKAGIKRSAVGDNCNIGKMARLTASILMDNVVVGEGAKLDACIIGPNVRIGDNAVLNNCEIGEGVFIDANITLKGEKLAHD